MLIMIAALSACSDKEGDELNDIRIEQAILGKWEWEAFSARVDDYWPVDWDHDCADKKDHWEFRSDKTLLRIAYNEDCTVNNQEEATYAIHNDVLTIHGDETEYTVEISGTRLTISYQIDMGDEKMTVIQIFKKMS